MEPGAINFNYPAELPVTEHRGEILAALGDHPVVVVCGDTGSGKTTQLPKMALELGRAAHGRRIACTQPRRLAAVSMAERVAGELGVEVGGLVGYRHRFERRLSAATRIEFMTDGVLVAETRFDPLLSAYDTIIVDEAHERSLNIDFLLGLLKRLLARRRDLKVVVSSATLDVEHFSRFFGGAPAVVVPGRLFPIATVYRSPPEGEERDLARDVGAAVAELPPDGDILVFLPGERDIRETAEYLESVRGGVDEIIPLLASLPAAEQRRAFRLSSRRRIILATNVAETSVTIPGIRAVVDSGLARLSRYVHRTQVQRLQIEPISQASARQRAGRCGRLGPGTCIRLYSEEDFLARDAFTPPEILRSSLAGVILTMLDLRFGDIDSFPFLDPPKPAMIREGLKELLELGAIARGKNRPHPGSAASSPDGDEGRIVLTAVGRKLAKIPVEPRLARMMLAASDLAVLPSVLPLVAAMACDDPRRRPIDDRARADQAHARFRVPGSDFLGTLRLWTWWRDETASLSQSKVRRLAKASYLAYPKMREWRDLVGQLESLARRLGLSFAELPRRTERDATDFSVALHRALLSGLLGRIGRYDEERHDYRGAFGLRFALHPGSVLAKKRNQKGERSPKRGGAPSVPEWIMAGELVDTARLFARNAAVIDVRWIEPVAGDVCRRSCHSPEWEGSTGYVRATEQVTLYGLVVVPARRCDYSRYNLPQAREIFIRCGLVGCDFPRPPPMVRENLALIDALRRRAEKSRRPEIFNAERLEAFFDAVIPGEVASADALRKWLSQAGDEERSRFRMRKGDWWPDDRVAERDFPDSLRIAGVTIALSYRHDPDDQERDGVTASVRKSEAAVLRLWRHDWLVPGLLGEKVAWMLSALPTALRKVLAPLDESTAILLSMLKPGDESLEAAVRRTVAERWAFRIPEGVWQRARLPPHLQMRFRIRDDVTGRTLALSRKVDEALADAGVERSGVALAASRQGDAGATTWVFGDVPEMGRDTNAGWSTAHYPALHDDGESVSLKLYADGEEAADAHEAGVLRLLLLALAPKETVPFRRAHVALDAALYLKGIGYEDGCVAADVLAGAVNEAMVRGRPSVRTKATFEARLNEDRAQLRRVQGELTRMTVESAAAASVLLARMERGGYPEATVASVTEQLGWMLFPGFPRVVPFETVRRYARYLKAIRLRLDRARQSPSSDAAKEARFAPFWARYREAVRPENQARYRAKELAKYRWMLEEFRVSIFAQELHTPEPVSPKRLEAKWAEAGRTPIPAG